VGMLLGCSRVSTAEQDVALQGDDLGAAGCWKVWMDVASGARTDRPELGLVLGALQPGSTLVVWRLGCLGQLLPHLVETVGEVEGRGVGCRSLTEFIDTTTPGGRLAFHIFGLLAQFEWEFVKARTMAGLAAARARGRTGGQPTVMTTAKIRPAQRMISAGTPLTEAASVLGVGRAMLCRHLQATSPTAWFLFPQRRRLQLCRATPAPVPGCSPCGANGTPRPRHLC
jgi:DNA invertase Pin-like site-specific DNA recombinase